MSDHSIAVPAVYAFIYRGDNILLTRRSGTGYEDGKWSVPSGHLKDGELPKDALVREVEEEVGVTIFSRYAKLVHTSFRPVHDNTGARADFFYEVHSWSGDFNNREPQKCSGLNWVHPSLLPKEMTPVVKHALNCSRNGIPHSELGIEWLKANKLYKL